MSTNGSNPKKRVILGLMTFGPDADQGARVTSLDEFKSCLDYFQGQGYNEVDTAHLYVGTKQQDWTRQAGWKERGLKLATKHYPVPGTEGHTPENVRKTLDWNLEQLGTDSVDIFYLHAPDRDRPFAETLEEVNKLYKEGKFKQFGLSNFTAFEVAECVTICNERGWVRPTIYQGMLNAITRSLELETIIACHRYGMQVVVYNPIAGGLFSGKIKSKADLPQDNSRFGKHSKPGEMYRERYFRDATFEALEIVNKTAKEHDLTMIEIALRWVIHHSTLNFKDEGGDGLIIGVSSQAQLESNLRDCEKGPLPDKVVEALDEAWIKCRGTTPNYWHMELKYTYDTEKAIFGTSKTAVSA